VQRQYICSSKLESGLQQTSVLRPHKQSGGDLVTHLIVIHLLSAAGGLERVGRPVAAMRRLRHPLGHPPGQASATLSSSALTLV
jgi:hypothetical protein